MQDRSHAIGIGPSQTARKAILGVAVAAGIAFLLVGDLRWSQEHFLHEAIEWFGIGLIAICIVGRTWCSLYIGGQKNRNLITEGPYSICRNPLYLFSIIGAVGVGAQVGSIAIALSCGFIAWTILVGSAMREEQTLLAHFGSEYAQYFDRVPRLLPRFALWRDRAIVEVRPRVVVTTFIDALVFLAAIPVAEGLEYLHEMAILPTWVTLP